MHIKYSEKTVYTLQSNGQIDSLLEVNIEKDLGLIPKKVILSLI